MVCEVRCLSDRLRAFGFILKLAAVYIARNAKLSKLSEHEQMLQHQQKMSNCLLRCKLMYDNFNNFCSTTSTMSVFLNSHYLVLISPRIGLHNVPNSVLTLSPVRRCHTAPPRKNSARTSFSHGSDSLLSVLDVPVETLLRRRSRRPKSYPDCCTLCCRNEASLHVNQSWN